MHVIIINEKRGYDLEKEKGGYMGELKGRKGKKEKTQFYYNFKTKRKIAFKNDYLVLRGISELVPTCEVPAMIPYLECQIKQKKRASIFLKLV